jgi:hypothetical protein
LAAIPTITVDSYGHTTTFNTSTYTAQITRTLTEGTKSATILGVDIYSGVEWSTF